MAIWDGYYVEGSPLREISHESWDSNKERLAATEAFLNTVASNRLPGHWGIESWTYTADTFGGRYTFSMTTPARRLPGGGPLPAPQALALCEGLLGLGVLLESQGTDLQRAGSQHFFLTPEGPVFHGGLYHLKPEARSDGAFYASFSRLLCILATGEYNWLNGVVASQRQDRSLEDWELRTRRLIVGLAGGSYPTLAEALNEWNSAPPAEESLYGLGPRPLDHPAVQALLEDVAWAREQETRWEWEDGNYRGGYERPVNHPRSSAALAERMGSTSLPLLGPDCDAAAIQNVIRLYENAEKAVVELDWLMSQILQALPPIRLPFYHLQRGEAIAYDPSWTAGVSPAFFYLRRLGGSFTAGGKDYFSLGFLPSQSYGELANWAFRWSAGAAGSLNLVVIPERPSAAWMEQLHALAADLLLELPDLEPLQPGILGFSDHPTGPSESFPLRDIVRLAHHILHYR